MHPKMIPLIAIALTMHPSEVHIGFGFDGKLVSMVVDLDESTGSCAIMLNI